MELRGQQHIPKGRSLIAPKHQCMLDVFAQFAWLPDSCFVTKKELMWIPFLGWYAYKGRMIVVDRSAQAVALRKMVADAKNRFEDERQLVIFPRAPAVAPGVAGDYKPGIAALYRELDVAVTPMATNAGVHWPAHGFLRHPGTIVYEYPGGDPARPEVRRVHARPAGAHRDDLHGPAAAVAPFPPSKGRDRSRSDQGGVCALNSESAR